MSADTALTIFKDIYKGLADFALQRGRISEADTRSNILDKVIHDVLGWPRDAVRRETHCEVGYLDYEFTHGLPLIVVEAKAEGETFSIPHAKQTAAQTLKVGGALTTDKTLRSALEQAQRYCNEKGIRYAIATNGYSFVIFRAITPGVSWRECSAVVFASPKIVESDFTTFWNLLSYGAICDGKLDEAFRHKPAEAREFFTPVDNITDGDATYGRNQLHSSLKPYVDRFFGDIASQDTIEVLKHCYVYSKPVQVIDEDLNITIKDYIPAFAQQASQLTVGRESPGGQIETEIRTSVRLDDRKGSVVLLMGGIGSGKTTFLKRFFTVVAPEITANNGLAFRLHLDFLGAPDALKEIDEFLWTSCCEALRKHEPKLLERSVLTQLFEDRLKLIRNIYQNEPETLTHKLNAELFKLAEDPKEFTRAALKFCSKGTRLPIVVFDNVDQLAVPIQTHIFTAAEFFANHLGCLSLLVIREESYSTAQMQKQLTAYTIRPYHLSSPSFREMIRLRIEFATNHASNTKRQPELKIEIGQLRANSNDEILDFFRLLRTSVFERSHNISRLLEAVSFGNMRFALQLFNNFITSGATNMPKILDKYRNGGYTVPFHEFAKSIILGDYRYYKESRSLISNIFHSTICRNSSHFTQLRILNYLSASSSGHQDGDGFVNLHDLVTAFVDAFDNEEDCVKTISKLSYINRQLIELDTRRTDTLSGAFSLRITTAGRYYLDYLVNSFSYLDIVWNDTPLTDRALSDKLVRLIHSVDMNERFYRVEAFLDYLDKHEKEELIVANLQNSASNILGPFMPRIRNYTCWIKRQLKSECITRIG